MMLDLSPSVQMVIEQTAKAQGLAAEQLVTVALTC